MHGDRVLVGDRILGLDDVRKSHLVGEFADRIQLAAVEQEAKLVLAEAVTPDRLEQRARIAAPGIDRAGMQQAHRQISWWIEIQAEIFRIEAVHDRFGRQAVFAGIEAGPDPGNGDHASSPADQHAFQAMVDPAPPGRLLDIGIVGPAIPELGDPGDVEPPAGECCPDERGERWAAYQDDVRSLGLDQATQARQKGEGPVDPFVGIERDASIDPAEQPPGGGEAALCRAGRAIQGGAGTQARSIGEIEPAVEIDVAGARDRALVDLDGERSVVAQRFGRDHAHAMTGMFEEARHLAETNGGDRVVGWKVPADQEKRAGALAGRDTGC